MGNFLYPRTITISRPNQNNTPGAQPYSGVLKSNETVLITNLAAHIEEKVMGPPPTAGVPADAKGQSIWLIIFRGQPQGAYKRGDVITDDQNVRYQVISSDWGPLVTTCRSQILES